MAYDKRGSLGMINLRERTELVNGLLNVQSQPGKGTLDPGVCAAHRRSG